VAEEGLLEFFGQYGHVQRAWLQRVHPVVKKPMASVHHRGFGFVIFRYLESVDKLLGAASSKHVRLQNGHRIEVKRAFEKKQDSTEREVWSQHQHSKEVPRVNSVPMSPMPTGMVEQMPYLNCTVPSASGNSAAGGVAPMWMYSPIPQFPGTGNLLESDTPFAHGAEVSTPMQARSPYWPPTPQMMDVGVAPSPFLPPSPSLPDNKALEELLLQAAPETYED